MGTETKTAAKSSKGGDGLFGNLKNSLFRQPKDVVIDVASGAMGVKAKNDEGEFIVTLDAEGQLQHNPIKAFGLPVPAFAFRTPLNQINAGDIVIMPDGGYSFVRGHAEDGNLKIVNAKSGRATDFNPANNTLLGNNGAMVIKNLFNFNGGGGNGGGGLGGMNPLMLMLLLGKDGDGEGKLDTKTLLLLMLMQGGNGQGLGGMNPLFLMLLLKGDDEDGEGLFGGGDSLSSLLMLQAFGGGCGGLGGLFGGAAPAARACCRKHADEAPAAQ